MQSQRKCGIEVEVAVVDFVEVQLVVFVGVAVGVVVGVDDVGVDDVVDELTVVEVVVFVPELRLKEYIEQP